MNVQKVLETIAQWLNDGEITKDTEIKVSMEPDEIDGYCFSETYDITLSSEDPPSVIISTW